MDRRNFLAGATLAGAAAAAARPAAAQTPRPEPDKVAPKVPERQLLFPLRSIALLDGPVARQRELNRQYLLKLEPDRLLSCFRLEAGLDPKAPPYRGWESEGLKLWGHILGFYLSGAGYMVQSTGDPELTRRLNYIVDELHAVQEANGSGYLLAVPGGKALFRDVAAGKFEITKADAKYGFQINGVFEPTYTWNKVTLGLYQAYQATGNPRARAVLIRTADWFGHDVLDHLNEAQTQKLLFCEHGSIHESMLQVYQLTGDRKYQTWARRLCFERMLAPLAAGDGAFLDGYHANCSIPVYTGAERVYQYNGETRLHTAAVNFLDEVIRNRSWVIGGNSAGERFYPPTEFEKKLPEPAGPENCNSVNMLRLIEAVYATQPDPVLMDHYERILWNHMLSAHDPERCMITYYTPMGPGSYRPYADEFDSMWCCVGTGLECPGKYGQMIYTRGPQANGVDVNLFVASQLDWPEAGLVLRQDTAFPDVAGTTLTVTSAPSGEFALRIRHPRWIPAGQMKLRVNGAPVRSDSTPGTPAVVRRRWQAGDRVEVELPMRVSVEPLPRSEKYAALLYGPIVLSGAFGRMGMTKPQYWKLYTSRADVETPVDAFPQITVPFEQLPKYVRKTPRKTLSFTLADAASSMKAVKLIPFYENHFQRYSIYWKRAGTAGPTKA